MSPQHGTLGSGSLRRNISPQRIRFHSRPDKAVTHCIEFVQNLESNSKEFKDEERDRARKLSRDHVPGGSKDRQPVDTSSPLRQPVETSPPLRHRFRSSEDTELQDTIKQLDSLEFSWLQPDTLVYKQFPAQQTTHQQTDRDKGHATKPNSFSRTAPVRESWRDKFRRNLATYTAYQSESDDPAPRRVGRFQNKNPTFPEMVKRVVDLKKLGTKPDDTTGPNMTIKPILIYTNVCKSVLCVLCCL